MFFLISHLTLHKYYPKLFTQFMIGMVFYTISFIIMTDLIEWDTYENYKYHILSMIFIDVSYLVYSSRHQLEEVSKGRIPEESLGTVEQTKTRITDVPITNHKPDSPGPTPGVSSKPLKQVTESDGVKTISFDSDMADFKVGHDVFSSDILPTDTSEDDIFSASEASVKASPTYASSDQNRILPRSDESPNVSEMFIK